MSDESESLDDESGKLVSDSGSFGIESVVDFSLRYGESVAGVLGSDTGPLVRTFL